MTWYVSHGYLTDDFLLDPLMQALRDMGILLLNPLQRHGKERVRIKIWITGPALLVDI